MKLADQILQLEKKIQSIYSPDTTLADAERLAGEFLYVQSQISAALKKADLDARMRKVGVKSIKAAVYMDAVSKAEKKPSDVMLEHIINSDPLVIGEQQRLDEAEVEKSELERIFGIVEEAHVHCRQISKGSMG